MFSQLCKSLYPWYPVHILQTTCLVGYFWKCHSDHRPAIQRHHLVLFLSLHMQREKQYILVLWIHIAHFYLSPLQKSLKICRLNKPVKLLAIIPWMNYLFQAGAHWQTRQASHLKIHFFAKVSQGQEAINWQRFDSGRIQGVRLVSEAHSKICWWWCQTKLMF